MKSALYNISQIKLLLSHLDDTSLNSDVSIVAMRSFDSSYYVFLLRYSDLEIALIQSLHGGLRNFKSLDSFSNFVNSHFPSLQGFSVCYSCV
jgi:hypothetical protein